MVWATRDIFILCCFISFGICFCVFCNQDTKERIPITQVCRIIDLLEARFPEKCYLSKLKAFLSRLEIVSTGLTLQKKIGLRSTFWPRETFQNLLCLCKKKPHLLWVLHLVKLKVTWNGKTKKTTLVCFLLKHSKFWSISLGQKAECKHLFFWRMRYITM